MILVAPAFGCATNMKMSGEDLTDLDPDQGVVVGSVVIRGGSDVLGRTAWELHATEADRSLVFWPSYMVEAERDGDEVVFVARMDAGDYHFYEMVQPGFSSATAELDVGFKVVPRATTYVGRLLIVFPEGTIHAGTPLDLHVENASTTTLSRARQETGLPLSGVTSQLMVVE